MIGAHVSVAGGVENAPANGARVGCEAIQLFTRSQRRWKCPSLAPESAARFREAMAPAKIGPSVAHASYLFNLAGSGAVRKLSCQGLLDEWDRAEALGLLGIVVHPGAHLGAGERTGIARIVESLDRIEGARDHEAKIILENTAGQGSCLGWRFEEIRDIFAGLRHPERFGVCLDTAHLFAAGHDIRTARGMRRALEAFDLAVGIEKVLAFHLNDSKTDLGSRVDRHEHVGRGKIGLEPFRVIVNAARFRRLPQVIEIPGEDLDYKRDIGVLKRLRD